MSSNSMLSPQSLLICMFRWQRRLPVNAVLQLDPLQLLDDLIAEDEIVIAAELAWAAS